MSSNCEGCGGMTPREFQNRFQALQDTVCGSVVTSTRTVRLALLGLVASGHVLVEDRPHWSAPHAQAKAPGSCRPNRSSARPTDCWRPCGHWRPERFFPLAALARLKGDTPWAPYGRRTPVSAR
jgi:hypothetical protein